LLEPGSLLIVSAKREYLRSRPETFSVSGSLSANPPSSGSALCTEKPAFPGYSGPSWEGGLTVGMAGWGGREQTSEWRNKIHRIPAQRDGTATSDMESLRTRNPCCKNTSPQSPAERGQRWRYPAVYPTSQIRSAVLPLLWAKSLKGLGGRTRARTWDPMIKS
jgi:hypothetical protein